MKHILELILAYLARKIVRKYQPAVIGITGSIGKTSAKEAIYAVLSSKFSVRKNIKNYNNELGVPLTIIGRESGGRSLGAWLGIFFHALLLLIKKDKSYPQILVLEMGADKPGDIEYLIGIAPCHIGVLTKIGPAHLEAFGTVENIAKEKRKIISELDKKDFAVVNFDDELVRKSSVKTEAQIISYGYAEDASVRAIDVQVQKEEETFTGLRFKIQYKGSTVPVFLPGVVGDHQVNSALAAGAVALAKGMNLIEISDGLKKYESPNGRMRLLSGKNETLLIDDTYNSSPDAAKAAVATLLKVKAETGRPAVAILGDMLELGDYTSEAHYQLGEICARGGVDLLVAVGDNKDYIARGAKSAGLDASSIVVLNNSTEAVSKVPKILCAGSVVLIKGSQGSRMEKVSKALLSLKVNAEDVLVRQSEEWLRK